MTCRWGLKYTDCIPYKEVRLLHAKRGVLSIRLNRIAPCRQSLEYADCIPCKEVRLLKRDILSMKLNRIPPYQRGLEYAVCIPCKEVRLLPRKRCVFCMRLNGIPLCRRGLEYAIPFRKVRPSIRVACHWTEYDGETSEASKNLKQSFTAITPRSTLTRRGSTC